MSFYSDASLVMIPSGYKDQKVYSALPITGDGDLTFSRASDATRVASNGLIEKVRTNLALRSQSFATTEVWATVSGTVTDNAGTAPDGTNTASKIVAGDIDPYVYQSLTLSGLVTASCYVKGIGSSIGKTGTIRKSASSNAFTITGDWQRVSVTVTASGSENYGIEVPDPAVSGDEVLLWGFQVEYGDIATDYIATTSAAVSVGPVSGLPRLDYLDSSAPRLLLEPQRTNLVFYSEQLDDVEWSKTGGLTVSANQTTSPSGYADADKVIVGSNQFGELRSSSSSQAAGAYSASIFAKKGDLSWCVLQMTNGTDYVRTWFNIETGVIGSNDSSVWTLNSSKIENYSNGWYRISITVTTTATTSNRLVLLAATGDGVFGAAINTYFFAWGGQVEAGAYATSYIPTTTAAVTRLADFAKKENIAGTLPTAYPFTLFGESEFYLGSDDFALSFIDISTTNTYFTIGTLSSKYIGVVRSSAGEITATSSVNYAPGMVKIAAVYTSSSIKLFANGALVATATNTLAFSSSVNDIVIGTLREAADIGTRNSLKQAIVFKSALTDAQAIELTTL